MAMEMGQSGVARKILDAFDQTGNYKIIEAIIHYAFDVERPMEHAFWKRDEVLQGIGRRPNDEYYPLALNGVGNFYFQFADWVAGASGSVVSEVKLYNKIGSHVQRQRSGPFTRSVIGQALTIC